MINLYQIQYTIMPRRSRPRSKFEKKKLLIRCAYKSKELGHTGRTNKILLVVKDNIPVKSFLLECIPALPLKCNLTIDSIEHITGEATTNTNVLNGG